jgi:hypothetical protein
MKKLAALGVALFVVGSLLTACAEVQQAENTLASPQTTQAATNLRNFVAAGTCAIANISVVEDQIAGLVKANEATQLDSRNVCVASAAVCGALGGMLTPGNCK